MDFGRENATTEFVDGMEQLDGALCSLTAILNRYPRARIVVGVDGSGRPLGRTFSEADVHTIRFRMKHKLNTVPDTEISIGDTDLGQYILMDAVGGDPPYSFDGWFHVRRCVIERSPDGKAAEHWKDGLTCAMKRH